MTHPEAARLGGDKRDVAILMADIRRFSTMAESMTPDTIVALLNLFINKMVTITNKYNGIIGSAVNATERIQRLAAGGQVVISEPLKSLLGDGVGIEKQFSKTLKGFNTPLSLYVVDSYRELIEDVCNAIIRICFICQRAGELFFQQSALYG